MSELPCNLNLFLQASFGQEEVQFRTDVLLPQPILLAPIDNAHICLTASRNSTSHIALAWTAVTGATNYVLQWGDSEDMSSPSLRQVILSTTAFTLFRNRDIRLGQTVYWRVFAINLSGGVSLPSATRQLTYTCPEGKEANKESTFNVEVELLGPDTIRSCEDTSYYIKLSFTSRDANQREIFRFVDVDWATEYLGAGVGDITQAQDPDNTLKVYINSKVTGSESVNLKLTATLNFLDVLTGEPFTKEVSKEIIAEPETFGCGIKCDEVCIGGDPENKTRAISVDLDSFTGDGLKVTDRRALPEDDPNYDPCACPEISIDVGCGIIIDELGKVSVNLEEIAGNGLSVVPGEGFGCPSLSVNFPGYTEYSPGCGISITEDLISLDYSDIAVTGTYQWVNNGCTATVLSACSPGGGGGSNGLAILQGDLKYETTTEPGSCPKLFSEVNLPIDCTLSTEGGLLRVETDIFGKGLKVAQEQDECLKVELCVPDGTMPLSENQVTGADLTSVSDVTKTLLYGYVEFDQAAIGCGDLFTKTYLPLGCHFREFSGRLSLDLTKLAGDGLSIDISGPCPLLTADIVEYTAGCGIRIAVDNVISIQMSDIATAGGYTWSDTNCSAVLATGCSTGSGLAGTAGVFTLPGPVLYDSSGACPTLHARTNLPYNCSLALDSGNLGINYGIFGKGLTVNDDDCPKIELCVEDGTSPITEIAGTDLDASGSAAVVYGEVNYQPPGPYEAGCGKLITKSVLPVGCQFDLTNGKLELDLSALAGAGLSLTDDECPKLKVDFSETSCDIASLLGLCDAPAVTPTTNDFVLGLRPGENGTCCIVKFVITACPTDDPPVDP